MSRCKLLRIEKINGEVLAYITQGTIFNILYLKNHSGKENEKECVCVYIYITHTHIYTYIHIERERSVLLCYIPEI